ncbi:hypothetical protein GCM10009838_58110 [Catenulispora subtropica]|uniref:Uncharacterized protein n=1 Tax=Catenulispora subtropica TaxID=450798 RepID=A0ABP5DYI6_9ACTN
MVLGTRWSLAVGHAVVPADHLQPGAVGHASAHDDQQPHDGADADPFGHVLGTRRSPAVGHAVVPADHLQPGNAGTHDLGFDVPLSVAVAVSRRER